MECMDNYPPVRHGEFIHIDEINLRKDELDGASVRVIGKLISFDMEMERATLEFKGNHLIVDISFWDDENVPYHINSLYQLIGELKRVSGNTILKVRVVRNIDGLDTQLYDEVLALKEQFFKRWADLPLTSEGKSGD